MLMLMSKGVFHKSVAWIGIASFAAAIIAMALFPVIGLTYFLWWIGPAVWCVAAGWKLINIGRACHRKKSARS